jgi:sec-independent protein translocase protein TatB
MFPEGRLFDFLIVGAVALIVVGPKDLPLLMRKVGQFMARIRAMAAEFRASFDELARQSELDELRREVAQLRTARPIDYAAQHIGGAEVLSDIETDLGHANAALNAPLVGATPTTPVVAKTAEVKSDEPAQPELDLEPKAPAR